MLEKKKNKNSLTIISLCKILPIILIQLDIFISYICGKYEGGMVEGG
jgi:hypothetical protein